MGWALGTEGLTKSESQRARSMGYSLQKEAEATQRGREEPGRGACHLRKTRTRGGGGQWLLQRECPSPAHQRRGLSGEVRGRPAPAGRHRGQSLNQEAASAGPVHLESSKGPVPRVEVGIVHPGFWRPAACWMLGQWGCR